MHAIDIAAVWFIIVFGLALLIPAYDAIDTLKQFRSKK